MLNALLETNQSESLEFFRSYIIQAEFLMYLSLAVICVVILCLLLNIIRSKKFFWITLIIIASLSGISE
ncbi:MAG: hypothetical protein IJP48_04755 [Synergistaceae bacterium]|nr:hypothetical protein [Synergistaceae bacterium]